MPEPKGITEKFWWGCTSD